MRGKNRSNSKNVNRSTWKLVSSLQENENLNRSMWIDRFRSLSIDPRFQFPIDSCRSNLPPGSVFMLLHSFYVIFTKFVLLWIHPFSDFLPPNLSSLQVKSVARRWRLRTMLRFHRGCLLAPRGKLRCQKNVLWTYGRCQISSNKNLISPRLYKNFS